MRQKAVATIQMKTRQIVGKKKKKGKLEKKNQKKKERFEQHGCPHSTEAVL